MTYTPTIYDWRRSVEPIDQIVRAGGVSIYGGMTLGGASVSTPEPGGRLELMLNFAPLASEQSNLDASWTVSRIMNGAVMRIRLWPTVQFVPESDLTVPGDGEPWSDGDPWASDLNWRANPWAATVGSALKGQSSVQANLGPLGPFLKIGHVVGFFRDGYEFAHVVMDIAYDADDVATVTVAPPLRRNVPGGSRMLFRPAMLAVCRNPEEVMSNFTSGRFMALGTARFVEALV